MSKLNDLTACPRPHTGGHARVVTPDVTSEPDCESPRSFVSALSEFDRASLKTGDTDAHSPRRSSMDAVAEDVQVAGSGLQRLQLSPTATALLRQARIALVGVPPPRFSSCSRTGPHPLEMPWLQDRTAMVELRHRFPARVVRGCCCILWHLGRCQPSRHRVQKQMLLSTGLRARRWTCATLWESSFV